MKKRIKKLAEEAGFIFWEYESWGPGPKHIDWACDYKKEFDAFVELMAKECSDICMKYSTDLIEADVSKPFEYKAHGAEDCSELIKKHFGVK